MTNVIELLAGAATEDVESAGAMWRIRKIKSSDIVNTGYAGLLAVEADLNLAKGKGKKKKKEDDSDLEIARKIGDKGLHSSAQYQEAVVCAGLIGCTPPGREYEPFRCTAEDESDHEKSILALRDLPAGVSGVLYKAIMQLSTDSGRAAKKLQSFRRKPGLAKNA